MKAVLPFIEEEKDSKSIRVSFVYISIGDTVNKDDSLIELVTDKATFDVPAPVHGKITEIYVQEGDDIKEGTPICNIEE